MLDPIGDLPRKALLHLQIVAEVFDGPGKF
jgi:hypothetical protein